MEIAQRTDSQLFNLYGVISQIEHLWKEGSEIRLMVFAIYDPKEEHFILEPNLSERDFQQDEFNPMDHEANDQRYFANRDEFMELMLHCLDFNKDIAFSQEELGVDLVALAKTNFERFLEATEENPQRLAVGFNLDLEEGVVTFARWISPRIEENVLDVLEEQISYYYPSEESDETQETSDEPPLTLGQLLREKLGMNN